MDTSKQDYLMDEADEAVDLFLEDFNTKDLIFFLEGAGLLTRDDLRRAVLQEIDDIKDVNFGC